MSDEVSTAERLKAAFIHEYRAMCELYGLAVIQIDRGGYFQFSVAEPYDGFLEQQVQEMLLGETVTLLEEERGK